MLEECLYSVVKNTDDYELIIVDNGSDDELASKIMRDNADIYIRNKENKGFGPGMNQGFKIANGDYVCFLNDDIVVADGWAKHLIASCGGGVACPALLPLGTLNESVEAKIELLNAWQADEKHNYYGVQKFGGFGACFIAKKVTFEAVLEAGKVFDERFKIAMFEDTDLWKRMEKAGRDVVCDHNTWVYHIGNGTVGKMPTFHEVYAENERLFKEKWGL